VGTRANICVLQHTGQKAIGGLYIYKHWDGYNMPLHLRDALERARGVQPHESRWDDEPYLARIILCEVVKHAEGIDGLSGCGLSIYPCDNNVAMLVVDVAGQRVGVCKFPFCGTDTVHRWIGFAEFAAMDDDAAIAFHTGESTQEAG
jgi:hypothetical protein